nr:hypothetical protein [Lachnospiraceae bacterium]
SDTSDSVINWSRLAAAARVVLTSDIVSDYLTYNDEAERIQFEIDKPENEEQKEDLYYDLLLQKGNLLLTLYRSAGLSPDMPPDLIAQPELRHKVQQLITEFAQGLEQISELQNGQAGNPAGPGEPAGVRKKEGKDFEREGKKSVREDAIAGSQSGDAWKTINEVKDFTSGTAVSINSLLKTIGAPVRDVTGNLSYNLAVSGIGAATSIVGLIAGFVSAVKLARTGAKLTGADHVSRAFLVSSQILKSTGTGTQGAFAIVDKFAGISGNAGNAASNVPWYGSTAARSVSETFSTVSGATQFCAGTLLLVGGTFQTASGYIEIGRTLSAQKAARKARLAMLRESRAGTELTKEKQKEREQLKILLKHQDRVTVTQGKTATVKAIGGSLTMMGGTFAMTGLLAPIGGIMAAVGSILHIGLGLIYARNKRNLTRRQAVDDALNLDSVIYTLKQSNPALRNLSKKKQEELKAEIRQEALGELGYATYKEAFSDLSKKNAVLLYHHVFEMPEGTEEYNMYYETLKSLGLKIRKAGDGQKNNLPTLQMIYAKLMG